MACYDDFDGAYFTCQALKLYHAGLVDEIIVVDNHPACARIADDRDQSRDVRISRSLQGYCHTIGAKYVGMPTPNGTAAPRNRVFQEATGDVVICIDSHVLLAPNAIAELRKFFEQNPHTMDLVQGPMAYDWLTQFETHFQDQWRGEMWGTWGSDNEALERGEPFEISAMGLGLFACRKEAWLGFNRDFRGFGGEEWYIHEKFRQAGRKTLCIPQVQWCHRFGRPGAANGVAPYRLDKLDKVHNYIIGLRELGISTERMEKHFLTEIKEPLRADYMARMLADPIGQRLQIMAEQAGQQPVVVETSACSSCSTPASLDDWYTAARMTPSDINEHLIKLNQLARDCEHITELGTRYGTSTVAFLQAQPKRLIAVDVHRHPQVDELEKLAGKTSFEFRHGSSLEIEIEETDLLFIDTIHTEKQIAAELGKHASKVRRYIVAHDTHIFGEVGEDGSPGIMVAFRKFLRANPEWTVIHQVANNHGLIVLSRDERDKKQAPGYFVQARNYALALARRVASGSKDVSEEVLNKRIELCSVCPARTGEVCGSCGCPVEKKALWESEQCPLEKW
jgi:glycosyltransferase involved in cell wall biosynthesis